MPRQNRVTPHGELIAVPDRGMFWGNRGVLVDRQGRLARYSRGRTWAICVLEYKGIRRQQWTPGRLTELFFLDEATGLAAGHRPCGECRYRDYQVFKQAWASWAGGRPDVQAIDARLHADLLKVGHHGSRTSSSAAFIAAVSPLDAVISAGVRNRFGHPHAATLRTLAAAKVRVFRTDQDGAVTAWTDGARLEVRAVGGEGRADLW